MKFLGIAFALALTATSAVAQDSNPYSTLEKSMNADGFWVVADFVGGNGPAQLDSGAAFTAVPLAVIPDGMKPVGQQPVTTSGGASLTADVFKIEHLNLDGCTIDNVYAVGAGVPYILVGTPLLKQLNAKLDLGSGRATFVCPSTGVVHVVGTPNAPIVTSEAGQ